MDRWERVQNVAGAVVFGAIGVGALAGVIFAGAIHQLVIAGISAAMVGASVAEIRRKGKRGKAKNNTNQ